MHWRFARHASAPMLALILPTAGFATETPPAALDIASGEATLVTEAPAQSAASAPPQVIVLPKLTPVYIQLSDPLSSKISKSGDSFAYTVAKPVVVDGAEVIPVGTPGSGQVIHAKKAGGSGSSGELVLSAGELHFGGKVIRLRSLNMDAAGRDRMGTAMAVGIVGGVAGLAGMLIKGKNFEYAAGFVGEAMIADNTEFSAGAPATQTLAEIPQTEPETQTETETGNGGTLSE